MQPFPTRCPIVRHRVSGISAFMSLTSLPDLLSLFSSDTRCTDATRALEPTHTRLRIDGLIGSGRSLTAHVIAERCGGTHVFILNDKEEAAYFMNDLEALRGTKGKSEAGANGAQHATLFFPAPSRSPYDPEGHHDGERVSRTEVLEELMSTSSSSVPRSIVTYAEAMAPLVVGREVMQKNTLAVKRGKPSASSTRPNSSHVNATSSGPCILGFTT